MSETTTSQTPTVAAAKPWRPAKLTTHEAYLLALYRAASPEARTAVDAAVWEAGCHGD